MVLAFIAGFMKIITQTVLHIDNTPFFDGAIILCIVGFLIIKNKNE